MNEKRPIYPIHPGEVLAEQLKELGMTGADLARALHVPANRIYQLLSEKRAMTAETALRLEDWLGVEAEFWLNLQKRYELERARLERSTSGRNAIEPLRRDDAA